MHNLCFYLTGHCIEFFMIEKAAITFNPGHSAQLLLQGNCLSKTVRLTTNTYVQNCTYIGCRLDFGKRHEMSL